MGLGTSKPTYRALLLGLDSAGKTTLLKGLTQRNIPEGPTANHNIGCRMLFYFVLFFLFCIVILFFSIF